MDGISIIIEEYKQFKKILSELGNEINTNIDAFSSWLLDNDKTIGIEGTSYRHWEISHHEATESPQDFWLNNPDFFSTVNTGNLLIMAGACLKKNILSINAIIPNRYKNLEAIIPMRDLLMEDKCFAIKLTANMMLTSDLKVLERRISDAYIEGAESFAFKAYRHQSLLDLKLKMNHYEEKIMEIGKRLSQFVNQLVSRYLESNNTPISKEILIPVTRLNNYKTSVYGTKFLDNIIATEDDIIILDFSSLDGLPDDNYLNSVGKDFMVVNGQDVYEVGLEHKLRLCEYLLDQIMPNYGTY